MSIRHDRIMDVLSVAVALAVYGLASADRWKELLKHFAGLAIGTIELVISLLGLALGLVVIALAVRLVFVVLYGLIEWTRKHIMHI